MGTCFELHFEKARGMLGEDVIPLRCQLKDDKWGYKPMEKSSYQRAVELYKEGHNQTEIIDILGLSKVQVPKHINKAKQKGDIKD